MILSLLYILHTRDYTMQPTRKQIESHQAYLANPEVRRVSVRLPKGGQDWYKKYIPKGMCEFLIVEFLDGTLQFSPDGDSNYDLTPLVGFYRFEDAATYLCRCAVAPQVIWENGACRFGLWSASQQDAHRAWIEGDAKGDED